MAWGLRDGWKRLRRGNEAATRLRLLPNTIGSEAAAPARSICIASGKGGTGKSTVVASLARCLARRSSCLLFDADLGVANAHILQGVSPVYTAADVLSGRVDVRAALSDCGHGLKLLAGGSGLLDLANLTGDEIERLATALRVLQHRFPYLMVDSAAGLTRQTMAFASASDLVLLVTTPAVTAMTDAYAFAKVLWTRCPQAQVGLVINRTRSVEQGQAAAERISGVTRRFLGRDLACWGILPEDEQAFLATQERRPVVEGPRDNALVQAMLELDGRLVSWFEQQAPGDFAERLGRHLFA
ncbi:MAG: AAA family ATPase [Planctomycetota bacterium]